MQFFVRFDDWRRGCLHCSCSYRWLGVSYVLSKFIVRVSGVKQICTYCSSIRPIHLDNRGDHHTARMVGSIPIHQGTWTPLHGTGLDQGNRRLKREKGGGERWEREKGKQRGGEEREREKIEGERGCEGQRGINSYRLFTWQSLINAIAGERVWYLKQRFITYYN